MARPIRFAPVLEGVEAVEFYERWQETLKEPLKCPPTKENTKKWNEFFRQHELERLNRGL
jgi:hypothetical protein